MASYKQEKGSAPCVCNACGTDCKNPERVIHMHMALEVSTVEGSNEVVLCVFCVFDAANSMADRAVAEKLATALNEAFCPQPKGGDLN